MQFAGRLVDNAQLRTTTTGQQVTGFTVALNENFKAKDGSKVQKTTYIDCAYWNRPNITPHLTKGLLVQLTGFPSVRSYTTTSGEARGAIDFRVETLDFLGGSNSKASNGNSSNATPKAAANVANAASMVSDDDDLPF
ncbi:single-stranded DNA-binding protein [Sphingobacterium lactis]|uniref:single-stranded DNA-binding protein n=1 Tax=Sphingobacterium TaxID=28453 RepID=UPI0021A8527A|nr:single-stranded DNA-binding protein [Sphingobacterium hotanense]MCT1526060.1 single-stranded DNA-binding protein [Sphingobacterium hotanense]